MEHDGQRIDSYSFGNFELFPARRELRKNGKAIKLAPQPFQALLLLVSRAGDVVTREEIQKSTWDDGTVVDFELGLNRCIRRVRAVLLDDADAPRYVETIPRIGYRFIAPVRSSTARVQAAAANGSMPLAVEGPSWAPPESPGTEPVSPRLMIAPAKRGWLRWVAIAGIAIVIGTAALYFAREKQHGVADDAFTPVPLSTELGMATTPSFSPGGQQIVFAWNGEKQDNYDIYLKMVGSPALVRLTSDAEIDYSPAWSPDGHYIAFCRGEATKGSAIWVTSPLGGTERKIVDIKAPAIPGYRALTWAPDARSIIYADLAPGDAVGALFVVDVDTGKHRQITFPPKGADDLQPASAPDGHAIAFVRDTGRGVSAIYVIQLHSDGSVSGEPRRLSWAGFEKFANERPKWTPDSRDLIFLSNRTGERQLWVARSTGGANPRLLASLGNNVDDAAISQNGTLAIVRATYSVNIWKLDLNELRKGMPVYPLRILASTRQQTNPSISPDGSQVAFESDRSGFMEIWKANADGTGSMQLTRMRNPITGSPSWSNDGTRLAFDSRATGVPAIYVVSSGGGNTTMITEKQNRDVVPVWSVDDRWIYFTSDRSGSSEIWKVPAAGGAPQQLTHKGGFAAQASPDGAFLYYSADRHPSTSLRKLDLRTGEESTIATGVLPRKYFPTKDGVFYMSGDPFHSQELRFYQSATGKSELLAKLDKPVDKGFAVSPDGSQIFYGQVDNDSSDLLLVEKFWH